MSETASGETPPEHNVTRVDFADRPHLVYRGAPLIDAHAHVWVTREGADAGLFQAEQLMSVAEEFGVERVWSMCPPEDIPPLRERFGGRLGFNAYMTKKPEESDDAVYRLLDAYLGHGVGMIKFWASPRAEQDLLFLDVPWRDEVIRRARAAGVRVIMVHVADPSLWFRLRYSDRARFGAKADHHSGLERLLQKFPDLTWIAAHMGGDPEDPDHLERLLDTYPQLYLDTSATRWQVREVSSRAGRFKTLIRRHPDRFLFGSDVVTRPGLVRDHYVSRYWSQRTLWESDWQGQSPIHDPDWGLDHPESSPPLVGLALPQEVLDQVYSANARRLLPPSSPS